MLKPEQIASVKGRGFLINRGTECFSGRLVCAGAVFTAADLRTISEIAEKFGSGKVTFTSRLSAEIVGIPFEQIDAACDYAAERGLYFGGTGAKIRPVTACKGTTCVYGNYDTQALAKELHEKYYVGWANVKLPHKFKIGIGGCPKLHIDEKCLACGVCTGKCPFKAVRHESPVVYRIYVGGTWGKQTRMGTPLSRFVTRAEIEPLLEKTMLWFKENAMPKERLGKAIDRLGIEKFEHDVFSDELLNRREEILAK